MPSIPANQVFNWMTHYYDNFSDLIMEDIHTIALVPTHRGYLYRDGKRIIIPQKLVQVLDLDSPNLVLDADYLDINNQYDVYYDGESIKFSLSPVEEWGGFYNNTLWRHIGRIYINSGGVLKDALSVVGVNSNRLYTKIGTGSGTIYDSYHAVYFNSNCRLTINVSASTTLTVTIGQYTSKTYSATSNASIVIPYKYSTSIGTLATISSSNSVDYEINFEIDNRLLCNSIISDVNYSDFYKTYMVSKISDQVMSITPTIPKGTPILYNGKYGIIHSLSSTNHTILGPPIQNGIVNATIGRAEKVAFIQIKIPNFMTVSDNKIDSTNNTEFRWLSRQSYLCAIRALFNVEANPSTEIEITVNNSVIATFSVSDSEYIHTFSDNQLIEYDDKIEVNITSIGSTAAGKDLTLRFLFIMKEY